MATTTSTIHFKVSLHPGDEIRRIQLDRSALTWGSLTEQLAARFGPSLPVHYRICYKDDDGDWITLKTSEELQLIALNSAACLRLFITEFTDSDALESTEHQTSAPEGTPKVSDFIPPQVAQYQWLVCIIRQVKRWISTPDWKTHLLPREILAVLDRDEMSWLRTELDHIEPHRELIAAAAHAILLSFKRPNTPIPAALVSDAFEHILPLAQAHKDLIPSILVSVSESLQAIEGMKLFGMNKKRLFLIFLIRHNFDLNLAVESLLQLRTWLVDSPLLAQPERRGKCPRRFQKTEQPQPAQLPLPSATLVEMASDLTQMSLLLSQASNIAQRLSQNLTNLSTQTTPASSSSAASPPPTIDAAIKGVTDLANQLLPKVNEMVSDGNVTRLGEMLNNCVQQIEFPAPQNGTPSPLDISSLFNQFAPFFQMFAPPSQTSPEPQHEPEPEPEPQQVEQPEIPAVQSTSDLSAILTAMSVPQDVRTQLLEQANGDIDLAIALWENMNN